MKIVNNGRGIHVREVPGLDKLKALPDDWHVFTNLDISLPGKGIREIDVVLIVEDRIILVDLKDWKGPIISNDGNWFNGKRNNGRSPVGKIAEITRELYPILKKSLAEQAKKEGLTETLPTPMINSAIVLTNTKDRSQIAESESASVFYIDDFIKIIRNKDDRVKAFGRVYFEDFTSETWLQRFRRFFNVGNGIFQPGKRNYGGFVARRDAATFKHHDEVYAEFDVEESGIDNSFGLLRRWDFTRADIRFQTEAGRSEIAGRERKVIAWLDDRSPQCGESIFKPKTEDPERGVSYWEVFERRRRMKRVSELQGELSNATPGERIILARQVLSSVTPMHALNAAHLDLGMHSVWIEPPSTVKLSHLMAASLPEVQTLGESRFQFLSTARVPEDILGGSVDSLRKDCFLLGCVVHTLLFGQPPRGEPPEWNDELDVNLEFPNLHPWFEKCLDIDQSRRFSDAGEMLAEFNAAFMTITSDRSVIEGLERFRTLRSQRDVFKAYPETEEVRDDERATIWRADTEEGLRLVKMWHSSALGNIQSERTRILAFLEHAQQLVEAPPQGCARLLNVHWTGDSIVVIQEYVPGATLSETTLDNAKHEATKVIDLSIKLVDVVENLHGRTIAHGDIKPDNIVVTEHDGVLVPVLIDVVDYSSGQDGSRLSRAYSPASGGRFERDRYAVTKITEELIAKAGIHPDAAVRIETAINECRVGPPANGTLLPLREALELSLRSPSESPVPTFVISIPRTEPGPILSDEGQFWIVKKEKRLRIVGAVEELSVELGPNGAPAKVFRNQLEQAQASRLSRQRICSLRANIVVEGGPPQFEAITAILQLPEVAVALAVPDPKADEGESELSQVACIEAKEDELVEREQVEDTDREDRVDVPLLWERSIHIEGELKSEVLALGDSTYRTQVGLHVVPIQLSIGDLDFDRKDVVAVERLDSKGGWRKIGAVDVQKTSPDALAIHGYVDGSRGPIVRDGDRLRFQSRMENTSWQRREEATTRILSKNAVAPQLVDAFYPSTGKLPNDTPVEIDEKLLIERYQLNSTQVSAFRGIVAHRPLGLLQGPPGTGKTRFIGALVHYALTNGLAKNVLVASQSHEAVNNAAEAVLNLFGKDRDELSMIRVGAEGQVSEPLRVYHAAAVERSYKDEFIATRERRIGAVASFLGLSQTDSDSTLFFEDTIRPILERISELADSNDDALRINTLKDTVQQCLLDRNIDCNLTETNPSEIPEVVTSLFFSSLPSSHAHKIERLRHVAELGRDIVGTVSTWQRSYETFLAGTRQVVSGTCVGLGRSSLGLTKTAFDLVVVDEAARCTPSELAVPIQSGKWIVLVGDHAQLQPQHNPDVVGAVAQELNVGASEIVKSDFERAFESPYGKRAGHTLRKQYRMLPPIGRLVSNAFYDRALQHERMHSKIPLDALPAELALPLVWVCTDAMGESAHQRGGSKRGSLQNAAEADLIVSLLKRCSEHEPFLNWINTQPSDLQAIGVICAYAAQLELVRKKLQLESLPEAFRRTVKVDTIDSYQGKENLIVLVSLVRNNADGVKDRGTPTINPGFMAKKNRINVALSRAMDRLVIVGAKAAWREGSPLGVVSAGFDEEVKGGDAKLLDAAEFLTAPKSSQKTNSRAAGNDTRKEGNA